MNALYQLQQRCAAIADNAAFEAGKAKYVTGASVEWRKYYEGKMQTASTIAAEIRRLIVPTPVTETLAIEALPILRWYKDNYPDAIAESDVALINKIEALSRGEL